MSQRILSAVISHPEKVPGSSATGTTVQLHPDETVQVRGTHGVLMPAISL